MAIVFTVMLTSLLFRSLDRITDWLVKSPEEAAPEDTDSAGSEQTRVSGAEVVICGFGALGQRVAVHLKHEQIPFIGIEQESRMFHTAQSNGLPVVFGNACRSQFLHGIHIDQARAVIIAMSNERRIQQVTHAIRHIAPELPVFVCASNHRLIEELDKLGEPCPIDTQEQKALALVEALQERESNKQSG